MIIHSSGKTTLSFPHIEGKTLGAGEEMYKVAGRASGSLASLGGMSQIDDRGSEGKAVGVFGEGFAAGFLAGIDQGVKD